MKGNNITVYDYHKHNMYETKYSHISTKQNLTVTMVIDFSIYQEASLCYEKIQLQQVRNMGL